MRSLAGVRESRIRHEESACVTAFVTSSLITRSASSSTGSSCHSFRLSSTNLRAAATLVSERGRSTVASAPARWPTDSSRSTR